jgi:hypothetical protein
VVFGVGRFLADLGLFLGVELHDAVLGLDGQRSHEADGTAGGVGEDTGMSVTRTVDWVDVVVFMVVLLDGYPAWAGSNDGVNDFGNDWR